MNTYKVEVLTTNGLRKTTYGRDKGEIGHDKIPYRNCEHGILYVITDDPKKIYDEFPDTVSIERIGIGYQL